MRTALDWGYQLLTPPAQQALQAMSVFTGGCDLAAFTAICHDGADPPPVNVIDELVRTSFAAVDFTGERTRYRLLEPVRQYARELLDNSGSTADRRRRHLERYLVVARSRTRDVDGVGDMNLDELRVELGNFRLALDWASSDVDSTTAGLSLAARLQPLWMSDGHHEEGLSRLVGLFDSGAGSTEARAEAAYRAGYIASDLGADEHALRLWEQAFDEAVTGGDKLWEARTRHVLSESAFLDAAMSPPRAGISTRRSRSPARSTTMSSTRDARSGWPISTGSPGLSQKRATAYAPFSPDGPVS